MHLDPFISRLMEQVDARFRTNVHCELAKPVTKMGMQNMTMKFENHTFLISFQPVEASSDGKVKITLSGVGKDHKTRIDSFEVNIRNMRSVGVQNAGDKIVNIINSYVAKPGKTKQSRRRHKLDLRKRMDRIHLPSMPRVPSSPPLYCMTSDASETKNEPGKSWIEYPVMFGTNRQEIMRLDRKNLFGTKRDTKLNLGTCSVSIPKSHRLAKIERPNWFAERLFGETPEKHFTILDSKILTQAQFVKLLKKRFAESSEDDSLLFIHGYNVKFNDAIFRTAQLGYDLNFQGVVTAFSWPSCGALEGYVADSENVRYSTPYLVDYIKLLLGCSKRLHIIAHSMGNVVLCEALKQLHEEKFGLLGAINQIILAAPDIDKDVFIQQIMPAIKRVPNITLYASDKDKALLVSKKIRAGYRRLGEGGNNILIAEGLDSIDASDVGTDMLGHGYFAATESLLNDIHSVLLNLRPDKRMLKTIRKSEKEHYWTFQRT
jgi:hypothetical protein